MEITDLFTTVATVLKKDPDSQEFTDAYAFCLSYLTNGTDAFTLQRQITPYLPKQLSAKVFRLELLKNKYNYFTLKLFVLQLSSIRLKDSRQLHKLALDMRVTVKDRCMIHGLWKHSPVFRTRICAWYKELPRGTDLTVAGIEKTFSTEVYPTVLKKIKSMTYNKLRFISRSANSDLSDLHCELAIKCLQTYYKLVPSAKGTLYVINYLKQTTHNHAMNMIKSATTQKHGRLVCTGTDQAGERVFSLRSVSENQMSLVTSGDSSETTVSLAEQECCSADTTATVDNEICVSTILSKYKMRAKKHRLLLLLMGSYDEQFTDWLRERKLCKASEDNVDVQEQIDISEFQQLVSAFLHVNDGKVNVFLLSLRRQLTGDSNSTKRSTDNDRKTYNTLRKQTNFMFKKDRTTLSSYSAF